MFAVKYREELETFLHLIYIHRHALPPPHHPNVVPVTRPHTQEPIGTYDIRQKDVVRTGGIVEQKPGRVAAPNVSLPLEPISEAVVNEGSLREKSLLTRTPLPITRGYANNPTTLSSSRQLSEMVGQGYISPVPIKGPGPNIMRQVPRQFQHHPTTAIPTLVSRLTSPNNTHPVVPTPFAKDASLAPLFVFYGLFLLANIVYETSAGALQTVNHFGSVARANFYQTIATFLLVVVAGLLSGSV